LKYKVNEIKDFYSFSTKDINSEYLKIKEKLANIKPEDKDNYLLFNYYIKKEIY
jgi:hypothetical protein